MTRPATNDGAAIVEAVEKNTKELQALHKTLKKASAKPTVVQNHFKGTEEGGLVDAPSKDEPIIHQARKHGSMMLFDAVCSNIADINRDRLTVSVDKSAINCPNCKQ